MDFESKAKQKVKLETGFVVLPIELEFWVYEITEQD
jgi:hypothetical protein